jgi:hypothetical protein
MPLTPLRINEESERELRTLTEQPPSQMELAFASADSIKTNLISPKALREALADFLPAPVVLALIHQVIGLRSYIDDAQVTPAEAIEALSLGLKLKGWSDDLYSKWNNIAKVLERFLSLENIVTIAKALELSLDFEHILVDSKILTDVRMVYSANRDKIIGGIVCNRLRIKMHEEDAHKSLSISIDKDEIEHLKKLCEDALQKIKMASDLLKSAGLASFVTGEGYDDFT